MFHENPSPSPSVTGQAKRPLYSGTALVVIVFCLVIGGASLLFTGPLIAMADRMTREPIPSDPVNSDPRLTDEQKLMYTLTHVGGNRAIAAVRTIVARNDRRFVPVLIEMLEANETKNQVTGAGAYEHVKALEMLTGENFRDEAEIAQIMAPYWIEWYRSTQLVPPEGFAGWKGLLLSRFDRRYGKLLRDGVPASIRVEEIHFSGIKAHIRPSLDKPALVSASEADFLAPGEPVYGVRVNGEPRAYPARIVHWHKAVNDVVDGTAISLTSCAQSAATICYGSSDPDGNIHRLETTGLVYRGNELFFDKENSTLWCQITGECVVGEPSRTKVSLQTIPVVLSSWQEWKEEHPSTRVASPLPALAGIYDPPSERTSNSITAEEGAASSSAEPAVSERTRVYGLVQAGSDVAKAYSLHTLVREQVVNDTVGHTRVVLIANDGPLIVQRRRRGGAARYLEGAEVRVYHRTRETFRPAADSEAVLDETGGRWEITEEALIGPGDKRVPRLNGVQSTWRGWQAFHPESELYQPAR